MNALQTFWKTTWRSILVALGYVAGLMISGVVGALIGWQASAGSGSGQSFVWLILSMVLLGAFLGPLATHLKISRLQHFVLWGSLITFNLGSVAFEGAYFCSGPGHHAHPYAACSTIARHRRCSADDHLVIRTRWIFLLLDGCVAHPAWYSWLWRFIVSSFSYLAFYFIFGGLNYSLVTKPYYETHAGGLTVPAPEIVFVLETVRGLLIVFSVLLFLLTVRGTRRQLMVKTGWLLFAVGGIIPLIWQISALPLFLLFVSGIEIFFQNFLTGVVAAWLMGIDGPTEAGSGI